MNKYRCPCCECFTFENKPDGNYDICPVCFWEDDPFAYEQPDVAFGCNRVSLNQAKDNYRKYGACSEDMVAHVRKPNIYEVGGIE